MLAHQVSHLRCPVLRCPLVLQILETRQKKFSDGKKEVVETGILVSETGPFFYPVIDGIPRLIVEAFEDYKIFFQTHLPDYPSRKTAVLSQFGGLLAQIRNKNRKTKQSFSQEWNLYSYEGDKTWDLESDKLVDRFRKETGIGPADLSGKWILDAGCGNGHLDIELGKTGARVLAMDFSQSIVRAYRQNDQPEVLFVQADVEFPPTPFSFFDIVHSSGVLIATQRTELSLSDLDPVVKPGGVLSTWSYKPSPDFIHNLFNFIRGYSSRLPVRLQYYVYAVTLLPVSYVIKRLKGNPQNIREMMIDILDWFSPEYRWEHEASETMAWYWKRGYHDVTVTDDNRWGYNMKGIKTIQP